MKELPEKFINALKNLLNKETAEANRLAEKLETEPEKSAEKIAHTIGSSTRPIKL